LGLVCFCSCGVAVGFVAIVKMGTTTDHVVCEGVIALTCDGYVGVGVDSANLITEIHNSYTCPEATVADMLVYLVESAVQTDARHGLQLS
jgi:hypothetical protein